MIPTVTLFFILVAGCIVAMYGLHLRPVTHRQWVWVAVTLTFLALMLPLMVSLRSR
jgi:hypothetical protein